MMTSLRWRREVKEKRAKDNEGEKTEDAEENLKGKRTIPAGREREGISSVEEEAIGSNKVHGYNQSEATSEGGEAAQVSHRQHGHSRQQAVLLLLIILGASNVLLLYKCSSGSHVKPPQFPERVVELHTSFTPPHPSAFLPFLDSEVSRESLAGVLKWQVAAASWGWVPMSSFMALLPPDSLSTTIQPGHVWTLLPDTTQGAYLLSTRYIPPSPAGPVEELLFCLLSLLHPQPFLQSRYGPRGAAAVVRARTGHLLEIWFRLHAEFQLNALPRLPLWFTPAAFVGRVVINSSDGMVNACSFHVPTTHFLNLDLEWLTGPNEAVDMEVTITHLPEMRVTSTSPVPSVTSFWDQQIPEKEALTLLEKKMYSFMEVQYHNFSEIFNHASNTTAAAEGQKLQNQQKLVHTMVLWGVLSDQSC